eukprot:365326-Chlamydomonas_euryale.AAC.15
MQHAEAHSAAPQPWQRRPPQLQARGCRCPGSPHAPGAVARTAGAAQPLHALPSLPAPGPRLRSSRHATRSGAH